MIEMSIAQCLRANGGTTFADLTKIACRCQDPLSQSTIKKLALFFQVGEAQVVSVPNVKSTYLVPGVLEKRWLCKHLSRLLKIDDTDVASALSHKGVSSLHSQTNGFLDGFFDTTRTCQI